MLVKVLTNLTYTYKKKILVYIAMKFWFISHYQHISYAI